MSKRGRKSSYSARVALAICERLAAGESLRKICRDEGMPSRPAVFRWLSERPDFRDQYEVSRQEGLKCLADELTDIADDQSIDVQSRRLMVDTRKWILCKLVPKQYGDGVLLPQPPKLLTDQRKPEEDNGHDMAESLKAWSDAAAGKQPAVTRRRDEEQAPPVPIKRPREVAGQDQGEVLREWRKSLGKSQG